MSREALEARARTLLGSDRVTEPTRRVLLARLDRRPGPPRLLDGAEMTVLAAVSARLVPLGDLQGPVDLAGRLDAQLADGGGDGWRYRELPPDGPALLQGLRALERSAGPGGFAARAADAQDALLAQVQTGEVEGWPFPPELWFKELLANLVQLAYAHPLVQADIGYEGMADAHGFQDVGLDARPVHG